jgi:hypothetical protein
VMLVTESDRLFRRAPDRRNPTAAVNHISNTQSRGRQQDYRSDGHFRDSVRTWSKKLCHTEIYNSRITIG